MATQVSDTSGKSRSRGSSSDELAVIAQRAQAFTNASGTAIALSEGNSTDEIICRARSGASAPDVGTSLRVEGSFTGLCIQSGKELRCDDAETDTRVDTAAIRSLGIRSMVVTPIKEENRVVGVLAVFAPTAHAFTITHVAVLKTMADQISVLLQKERRAKEDGTYVEPARPAAAAPAPAAVTVPKPTAAAPVVTPPAPVVIKPAPIPARSASFPVVSRVEPIKPVPVAEDITMAPPVSRREERRNESRTDHRPSFGTLDAAGGEEKSSKTRLMVIGAALVAVVATASVLVYRKMNHAAPTVAQQHAPETTTPAASGSTTPPSAAPGIAPTTGAQPSTTAPGTTSANNVPPAVSAPPKAADATPADTSRKTDRNAAKNSAPAVSSPRPTPAAVALNDAASKINRRPGDQQAAPDVAPVLNVGNNAGAPGALTALTRTSGVPAAPATVSQSDLEPLQVLRRVKPVYPTIAQTRRLSGSVVVDALVGKDGKAGTVTFVSGAPIFKDAAFAAVKQWLFKPARLNGQAIDQHMQIRLDFTP